MSRLYIHYFIYILLFHVYNIYIQKPYVIDTIILKIFNVYLLLRERGNESRGRGRERGRQRIQCRLQALSCQHSAPCGARTHKLWDHDLSQSWILNWVSHPGASMDTIISPILQIEKFFKQTTTWGSERSTRWPRLLQWAVEPGLKPGIQTLGSVILI